MRHVSERFRRHGYRAYREIEEWNQWALVLLVSTFGACGGDDVGPTSPPPAALTPTTLSLSEARIEFAAVPRGQQVLTAIVRDQDGVAMDGVAITWSSSDPEVAELAMTAEARSIIVHPGVQGSTEVTAQIGGLSETVAVVVDIPLLAFLSRLGDYPDEFDDIEIFVVDVDGTHRRKVTTGTGSAGMPQWSPDGERIAFHRSTADGVQIYSIRPNGRDLQQLTWPPGDNRDPHWSPDGTRIAFSSDRDGNGEIYMMDSDGSNQVNLTIDPDGDAEPRWSPDGGAIAFTSDRTGDIDVYVVDVDGSDLVDVSNGDGRDGSHRWSPDGSRLAFEGVRLGYSEIFVVDRDGSGLANVTNHPASNDRDPECLRMGRRSRSPQGATASRCGAWPPTDPTRCA